MGDLNYNLESEYFINALGLFHQTQWLYNVPVTEILVERSLDAIPKDWLDTLHTLEYNELNDFVTQRASESPDTLKLFALDCKNINLLPESKPFAPIQLPKKFTLGLSRKKQHEVIRLANLIHSECTSRGIDLIVDFGSGLGYVCQLLYYLYGYKVLGLERSELNVKNAKARQNKLYPDSIEHVKYTCYELESDSVEVIHSILNDEFPGTSNICLIGLHACGDLSIHTSSFFARMEIAHTLILISCCYHKLVLSNSARETEKQYFDNFPLSHCLRNAIKTFDFDIGSFLRQPFLRLASQEPAERWNNMSRESHEAHSLHVLARAVLQLYAHTNGYSLKKRVQKGTRKSQCSNFPNYIKDALLRYTFASVEKNEQQSNLNSTSEMHETNMLGLWNEHCDKLKAAEIYTGLQLMLQGPAESLVLNDRLCWMKEQGFNAKIVSVMDKTLSPRSYAIVSHKR